MNSLENKLKTMKNQESIFISSVIIVILLSNNIIIIITIFILCVILGIVLVLEHNKILDTSENTIEDASKNIIKQAIKNTIQNTIQNEEIVTNQNEEIASMHNLNMIMPNSSKIIPSEDYTIINSIVKDYTYYRLGVKTELEFNNTLLIQSIINNIISIIKDNDIKNNLQQNKPLFLIGPNAHYFLEFQVLKDMKSAEGLRNILDVLAFGPNKPTPGFISEVYNNCVNTHWNENVVFHEYMHAIHYYGMTEKQQLVLTELYNKYNVRSNYYNIIDAYAFVTVLEFFAVMASVYCQMTFRLDITGNITNKILKDYLPELYIFLESIFDVYPNHVLNTLCDKCNQDYLCCRNDYQDCAYWESNGDCNTNSEFMKTRCRKSCKICQ